MSPEQISLIDGVQERVRDAVLWYRAHGYERDDAFAAVADDLGISRWQAQAFFYRDGIWRVAQASYDKLMRRWGAHLDRRMAVLEREAEELRVKRAQLNLTLDGDKEWPGSGTCSPHGQRREDAQHWRRDDLGRIQSLGRTFSALLATRRPLIQPGGNDGKDAKDEVASNPNAEPEDFITIAPPSTMAGDLRDFLLDRLKQ